LPPDAESPIEQEISDFDFSLAEKQDCPSNHNPTKRELGIHIGFETNIKVLSWHAFVF
jgi:hypothetical protein